MKKKIIIAIVALLGLWIVSGIAARRSILTLIPTSGAKNLINYEDFVFGVQLNSARNKLDAEFIWLDENEGMELGKCISNAGLGPCIYPGNMSFMNYISMHGRLYLAPRWVQEFGIKHVLRPLMHPIEVFYWPSKNLLYLTEDIGVLGYDFTLGLNVTNVHPSILKVKKQNIDHKSGAD